MTLNGVRVLVADDQTDVAKTLTEPLRAAGAVLRFASNGEQALQSVRAGGNDLLIVDMKMPPESWGGLWLLEQLQSQQIVIPTLVLSGEGQQRQTIEAMRFGAKDWIQKSRAGTELVAHCAQQMQEALSNGVDAMATRGPSPLAYAFARYQRSVGGELQYSEGLRLLEQILHTVALLGLASCPAGTGPLRGLSPGRLVRPSFGTWLAVIRGLTKKDDAGPLFAALVRSLMPRDHKHFERITQLRNDHAHGGKDAGAADRELVFSTIDACAHRFQVSPFTIGSHAQMRYTSGIMVVSFLEHRGTYAPRSSETTFAAPNVLNSPDPYLFSAEQPPIRLDPWMCVFDTGVPGVPSLAVFDGVRAGKPDRPSPGDALLYTVLATGERRKTRNDNGARWAEIETLFIADAP